MSRISPTNAATAKTTPRRVSSGDTLTARSVRGVARQSAKVQRESAQGAQGAAVTSILAHTRDKGAALLLCLGSAHVPLVFFS